MLATFLIGILSIPVPAQVSDTVFPAGGATRIQVENRGGSVVVEGWDRNEVHLRADHGSRTEVLVRRRGNVISVETRAPGTGAGTAHIHLSLPRSLAVRVEGLSTNVTLEGTIGDASVETMNGAIEIVGGQGRVRASSVNGLIRARDTGGRLELRTMARAIEVNGAQGEVFAESVSGPIRLTGVRGTVVEAGSVSGSILYDGVFLPNGRYDFGSHSGRITMIVPGNTSASIVVASFSGSLTSAFPAQVSSEPRRRSTLTVGGGEARVEAETFSGSITLLEAGSAAAERELSRGAPRTPPAPRAPTPPTPPRSSF